MIICAWPTMIAASFNLGFWNFRPTVSRAAAGSCYAANRDTAALWDDLRDLDETFRSGRSGAVQVQSIDDAAGAVEPATLVQAYAAVTQDALAAGFTGLRVAVEATSLVRSPEQLDTFARFEHLIDRYMTRQPFSALCAYNRVELGEETIAQVACLHPTASDGSAPFRLHASTHAAASLSGELDLTSLRLFPLTLRTDLPGPARIMEILDLPDMRVEPSV